MFGHTVYELIVSGVFNPLFTHDSIFLVLGFQSAPEALRILRRIITPVFENQLIMVERKNSAWLQV